MYEVPAVKPETDTGDDTALPVKQPGVEIAEYKATPDGVVPMQDGAEKDTDALKPAVAVAATLNGWLGFVGHVLAPFACICWVTVQIPDKLGITSSLYKLMGTNEYYRAK